MEKSLFWDAQTSNGVLDRVYSSDDFAAMFAGFWGSGLIPNVSTCLWVEPIENSFALVVNPGDAFINGRFYQNTADYQITLPNGNTQQRIDYIALRYDSSKRKIYLKLLEGAEGEGSPTFAQSDSLFDLILAKVTIPANAQYLTDEMVEDMRGTSLCPWINLRFDLDAIVSSFEAWYNNIRTTLDEDVAIQLQNQIQKQEAKIESLQTANTTLQTTIAGLEDTVEELKAGNSDERKYDNVVKGGAIYIRTRPYDASIDTDIP